MNTAIRFRILIFALPVLLLQCIVTYGQKDHLHNSKVFNREKPFRVYLPATYEKDKNRRYPVLYYMHGNKGTHKLPFENIQELVDQHELILVCWNGRSEDSDERPYNVGYHSNINYPYEFSDYFIEFYKHIDSSFRTDASRKGRAVFGHSMGGFVAYVLAQKFPHLVGLVVNSKGSPEFFMGAPENHTLIQHRYLFGNLHGVLVRFQHSTEGEELFHLNNEVHAAASLEAGLQYNFKAYDNIHFLNREQFKDGLEWAAANFKKIPDPPERWNHASTDPAFHVWGYDVASNLNEPGFISLRNVTKDGFSIQTRKWLPDGPAIAGVQLTIKTPPTYKANEQYEVKLLHTGQGKATTELIRADAKGRLEIRAGHDLQIAGITHHEKAPALTVSEFAGNGTTRFIAHRQTAYIKLRVWNRGTSAANAVKIRLTTLADSVLIEQPEITVSEITTGQNDWLRDSFRVHIIKGPPTDGSNPYIRFNLLFTDSKGHTWKDEIDLLPLYAVNRFEEIGIDDGDSEIFGSGNGNNIAEPGELIMVYQENHRTRLFYDDPYVISERLHDDLQPDKWGDGYALSSLIRISPDCPPGHVMRFLACYEIKQWNTIKRKVTWGHFNITIGNKKTPAP